MSPLPVLFLSHGSPMHAIQPGAVRAVWQGIATDMPKPKAILIASAHWETDIPALTGAAKPETIHDFYGFPQPLYEVQYPAPGDPALAQRALGLLQSAGFTAAVDSQRGLDHGAWSPLLHMYPEADIPVVQVAVQTGLRTRHHIELGKALAPLAAEGVLIIGSGHMTHNLRERRGDGPLPYAAEFQEWVRGKIESGDLAALVEYRTLNPHGVRAHPTDEHFLPLFVALGAAGEDYAAERLYNGIEMGSLAMDAWRFSQAGR